MSTTFQTHKLLTINSLPANLITEYGSSKVEENITYDYVVYILKINHILWKKQ